MSRFDGRNESTFKTAFECGKSPAITQACYLLHFDPSNLEKENSKVSWVRSQVSITVLGVHCAILQTMWSRASRISAVVVLLTCLICPILETFDSWDDTVQTGNDTEYTLVILALCVGVAYSFAHFTFKSELLGFVAKSAFGSGSQKSFLSSPCSFTLLLLDATSFPPLPLRI